MGWPLVYFCMFRSHLPLKTLNIHTWIIGYGTDVNAAVHAPAAISLGVQYQLRSTRIYHTTNKNEIKTEDNN